MKLRLTGRALRDLREIVSYLEIQSPPGRLAVEREISAALATISDFPQIGRLMKRGVRRLTLPTFPYAIFYRIEANDRAAAVLAVRHAARKPRSGWS